MDDLAGRLIDRKGWSYVRLAAVCDDAEADPCGRELGKALWPERRPREWLAEYERSPITWASLYQGRPRPPGETLFHDVYYYDTLPDRAYSWVYGADLAYTAKTSADWSVLIQGRVFNKQVYLTHVVRRQCERAQFTAAIKPIIAVAPGPCLWLGSSLEREVADDIKRQVPMFRFELATTDKNVRALPTAEKLWNTGKILLPSKAPPRVGPLLTEVTTFTGVNDPEDNQVDALAGLGQLVIRVLAAQAPLAKYEPRTMTGRMRRSRRGPY